jgi:hypothetical protein
MASRFHENGLTGRMAQANDDLLGRTHGERWFWFTEPEKSGSKKVSDSEKPVSYYGYIETVRTIIRQLVDGITIGPNFQMLER